MYRIAKCQNPRVYKLTSVQSKWNTKVYRIPEITKKCVKYIQNSSVPNEKKMVLWTME